MVIATPDNRTAAFLRWVEQARQAADARLDPVRRIELGQFLTPEPTARLVAGLVPLDSLPDHVRLLDPGAGVGSLTAAFVARLCDHPRRPSSVSATVCEVDPAIQGALTEVLRGCHRLCEERGIRFDSRVIAEDFIDIGVATIRRDLFSPDELLFDLII